MNDIFTYLLKVFFCLLLLNIGFLNAQESSESDTSEVKIINIKNSNSAMLIDEVGSQGKYLMGDVILYQDSAFMYCDTALLSENQLTAFGDVVIIQNDTINIFSDSLRYNGDLQFAYLYNNVVLQNGGQELFSDSLSYDMENKIGRYEQGALLRNKDTDIKSKVGVYFVEQKQMKFYENVSVINEEFELRTDSLLYDTEANIAYFLGPTVIDQDTAQIYCESGFYDLENEIAEFSLNPQYVKNETTANAVTIRYNGALKEIRLIGNAHYDENEKHASADTIIYFEETEDVELIGNASYMDDERQLVGKRIKYNSKTESFYSLGRSTVQDSTSFLTANLISFEESEDFGVAYGKVILQDTSSETTILADTMNYRQEEKYYKAFGNEIDRALLITIMDGDSLFIKSDTLLSQQNEDSTDVLNAFFDVKLFKSDLQATCDSMIYNTTDSIIAMYNNPVIWSDSSQFKADTIIIYLKNNEIHRVELKDKAFIINTTDSIYFNQIKGKMVEVFFEDGVIDSMSVQGNSESIYFMMDEEEAYIGMNKSICSNMSFTFMGGDLKDIYFHTDVNSTLSPMDKLQGSDKLEGFQWLDKERPKTRLEL